MRQFADPAMSGRCTDRRIFRLEIEHEGTTLVAEVGKVLHDDVNELVFAIFESEGKYFICTLNHGIAHGKPLVVYANAIHSVIDFESVPDTAPIRIP